MSIKTTFVSKITVIDPDSKAEVELEIRKLETGGMVGLDGSFLEQDVGPCYSPYDKEILYVPDNEDGNEVRCSFCGHDVFLGTQHCEGSITVKVALTPTGQGVFIGNVADDGSIDSSQLDYDNPHGPYECERCGHAWED